MSWSLIITLLIIGIILIILEILVIPGAIAGIVGFLLMVYAVFEAFQTHGTQAGFITLISTLIATGGGLFYALRSKTWKKLMLQTELDGKVNVINQDIVKAGDKGITVSRLAPSGKAQIHDEIYEVHTHGEFVDPNTPIIVLKAESNKIYVKSIN